MISKGWIKLHRKIQDHWIYQEDRVFSRYEAWLDLIMLANHKDNKSLIDGELVTVKKGSLITSKRKLSDRWKWSNTKTDNFLKLLEQDGMITHKSDTKKTVITVVNYEVYHEKENEKRHENDSEVSGTSDEQVDSGNYNLEKNDTEKTVESFDSSELFPSEENEKRHRNDTKTTQKHIKNETETYKQECIKNDQELKNYKDDDDNTRVNPFVFFESEGFGTLTETIADNLGDLIDTYGETLVIHAMREAVLYGARNLKYVSKILENPNSKKGGRDEKTFHQHRGRPSQPKREDSITGGQLGWINRKRNTV